MVREPVTWLGIRQDGGDGDGDATATDTPSAANFLRRAFAQAAVLGNFLYIDGGMVSQRLNGQVESNGQPLGVNSTISLDLSTSWKPDSVDLQTITKPVSPANMESLWDDTFDRSFYLWGGAGSVREPQDRNVLWKFSSDSGGRGGWTEIQPSNLGTFESLMRVTNAASASAEPGQGRAGYSIGGTATSRTEPGVGGGGGGSEAEMLLPIPGIVIYNVTQGAFSNESTTAFTETGTWVGGSAEYVPGFSQGGGGILALFGGLTPGSAPLTSFADLKTGAYLDHGNITLYDAGNGQWYWQETTGTAPGPRSHSCTVGVTRGDGGDRRHEIFLYGGTNIVTNVTYDDVFVLTIPGFSWHELDSAKAPRSHHSCVSVGRQMISVGGYQGHLPDAEAWSDPDPFPQGLGVFDLTEAVWKSDYDGSKNDYGPPKVVAEFYQDWELDKAGWSNDAVKQLFTDPDSFDAAGESSKLGVILGTVIATVAAIIVAGIGLAFFCRRRRRDTAFQRKWSPGSVLPSWTGTGTGTGASGTGRTTATGSQTTGMGSGMGLHRSSAAAEPTERFELADTQVGAELPGGSNQVQFELYSPQEQRAGWPPVRESWISTSTAEAATLERNAMSPLTPVQYRDERDAL